MRYHGTDEDSAIDIVQNGLNRKKWQTIIAEHGGDPSGFSLTDDLMVARQHAVKAATMRGQRGAIIAAEESELPTQATGDGTESFDPGETKILPGEMKHVGSGVFTIIERGIAPLHPSANP